jgi:AraC-like DNA-binding protein
VKPRMERVTILNGCSIRVYNRCVPDIPFQWHHHPEFELTLTLNSRGLRFIGDHVGPYGSNDLVLIPSDMPHTWASNAAVDPSQPHQAIVLWFSEKWAQQMAALCPEYAGIGRLLKKSGAALSFGAFEAQLMLTKVADLLSDNSVTRLNAALDLLNSLGESEGQPLAELKSMRGPNSQEWPQLNRVLEFMQAHYSDEVRVEELCKIGNMSSRTLHRAFMAHVGQNVSDYLRKLRIGHACMLLLETDLQIAAIASRVGFFSMSNFNRAFLETRAMTPTEFRRFVQKHNDLSSRKVVTEEIEPERSFIMQRDKLRQLRTQ